MKKKSNVNRTDRLNSEFKKDIYDIITRKIHNPLVSEMFSVLKVDTSKDLSHAKVYISIYSGSEEKRKATFGAIVSDAKKIRYEMSKTERLRTVPELTFILDDSMEYSDKMEKLFKSISTKREESEDDGKGDS